MLNSILCVLSSIIGVDLYPMFFEQKKFFFQLNNPSQRPILISKCCWVLRPISGKLLTDFAKTF